MQGPPGVLRKRLLRLTLAEARVWLHLTGAFSGPNNVLPGGRLGLPALHPRGDTWHCYQTPPRGPPGQLSLRPSPLSQKDGGSGPPDAQRGPGDN